MNVTATRDVAAPLDKVFALLADATGWPRWNPNFKDVTPLGPGPFAVGYQAKLKSADGPEATAEVATLEPGKRVVWKSKVMGMTLTIVHAVADKGAGATSVTFETSLEGGLGSLMGGFMKTKLEKALNDGLDGLKKAAEAK